VGQLLPTPAKEQVSELLKRYVSARIDFMRANDDQARIEAAGIEATNIEGKIWELTQEMAAVVQIFRFDELIAELRDVGQAVPEDSPNEIGRF
jgi:hypothetical protein